MSTAVPLHWSQPPWIRLPKAFRCRAVTVQSNYRQAVFASHTMKNLFPGYYRPTDEQLKKNFEEGVFCFDTNVLLNLYRFTAPSREELLSILQHQKIKDRVWLPHQVALEYHENRIA